MTVMRGLLPVMLLALLLSACAQDEPRRPQRVVASAVLTGPEAEAVRVHVSQMPPGTVIESIALIDPEGTESEAAEFRRGASESGPILEGGSILGIGVVGGLSSGVSTRASVGTGGLRSGDALRTQQITAQIPVPDPAAYLVQVRDWRIEVRYRDVSGSARVLILRAPRSR